MAPDARPEATNHLSGDVCGAVVQARSIYGGVHIYFISNKFAKDATSARMAPASFGEPDKLAISQNSVASLPGDRSLGSAVAPTGIAGNGPGKYATRMHPAASISAEAVSGTWLVYRCVLARRCSRVSSVSRSVDASFANNT